MRIGVGLAALLVWAGLATAQDGGELAGAMLQRAPYLLTEDAKGNVDELNRTIREASSTLRKRDASDEDKAQATARRDEADAKLAALLEGLPSVVRVTFADGKPALAQEGAFVLPGNAGALLLRVERSVDPAQAGAPEFAVVLHDFSEKSGPVEIPARPGGVTWALLAFSNVPKGRSIFTFRFAAEGTEPVDTLVEVNTPEQGRLKLTVLSDDTGEPAPAMVRLVWLVDGQVRRPDNGIDFAPQFDHQGGARVANLPGALRGLYWCVPGPIDMALPAGKWEVTVRRGLEHAPVTETIDVSPLDTVERRYRPRRWADMRELGWYSGDDHVHAQILSDTDADHMMTWAQAEDVHLCNIVKMGDIYRTWFEQRGFGKDYRVVRDDYVLAPGQECPRTHDELGHTLAMNITHMIRDTDKYYLYDLVFDQVHADGGLSGYAHVGWEGFSVHRDMSMNIAKGKVDFVELLQFANINPSLYYEFLNTGFKVIASAGSDVPWGGTIGEVRVYVHTGRHGRFSADRWFDAMGKGHTFITNGPMLEFTVNDAIPGDQLDLRDDKPLRVRARAWGDPHAVLPAKLEIVRHGEVIKSVEAGVSDPSELTLDFELEPGDGCWLAARAEGEDGTKAHTTPVYVVRPGLRFWKFDEAGALIDKRLASLGEIEKLLADYTARDQAGEFETNRGKKQFVVQGSQLMERVEAARALYADLQKTIEYERSLRNH